MGERLGNFYKFKKTLFLMATLDAAIINLSLYLSFYLRFDGFIPGQYFTKYANSWPEVTGICLVTFVIFNLYGRLWKFASVGELISIISATSVATMAVLVYTFMINNAYPRSIYIIFWLLLTGFIGFSRLVLRASNDFTETFKKMKNGKKRVLIVGAGHAGSLVIKEFKQNPELEMIPVGIIDDDKSKHGLSIYGVRVLGGREKIPYIVETKKVEEIIIAMPSVDRREVKKIADICSATKCKVKIVPGIYELLNGKVDVRKIRDIRIEDLLGREPVRINMEEAKKYLKGKKVLVTGAGGSIGSELVRQVARFEPELLLLFDISENNIFDLEHQLKTYFPKQKYIPIIGSIRDVAKVEAVMAKYRPDVVFHAAAHKHVPLMELNPMEAIKNNVFGTLYVAEAAKKYKAERFILISTDKAVNPKNVMGASKRVAEIIIQMMAKSGDTRFAAVRFGNVLGSAGSVIPLFKKQIEAGGPVTVTHPEVTRYFMTIPEAVQLVIQAGAMAEGGEIFVLDMGEPVKILDLATEMIKLSGLEPGKDIKIEFIGLRPGEKLHEELFYDKEDVIKTQCEKIYLAKTSSSYSEFKKELENLKNIFLASNKELQKLIERFEEQFLTREEKKVTVI
ncbi:MAG: polysaccharide biosynthesis protein [Thermosediminibacteraceae bacterium]|nr:polysaccharide biosynthesis protein [Thermosediminibacteraceae bacterium]